MEQIQILFRSSDHIAFKNFDSFWIFDHIEYFYKVKFKVKTFRIATIGMVEDENVPLSGFRKGFIRCTYKLESCLVLFLGGVIPKTEETDYDYSYYLGPNY